MHKLCIMLTMDEDSPYFVLIIGLNVDYELVIMIPLDMGLISSVLAFFCTFVDFGVFCGLLLTMDNIFWLLF